MADILDLLSPQTEDDAAAQRAQAMSAALRGRSRLGELGMLTGDSVLAPLGNSIDQHARADIGQLNQVPQLRQGLALSRAKLGQEQAQTQGLQAQQAAMQDPQTARVLRQTLARYGVNADEGTPAATMEKILPTAEQGYKSGLGKFAVNPVTGAYYDTRTGQQMGGAPAGGGNGVTGLKPQQVESEFKDLATSLSTVTGRSNLNRENQDRLYKAERLQALVLGQNGDIQNLTPQQVREAGTALANLISSGSMTEGQIDALTPESMAGRFSSLKQKIMNEPQGADAQAFLQNMLETTAREKRVISQQIRAAQEQGLPRFAHLGKLNPTRYRSMLTAAGLNPDSYDENGLPAKSAAPAAQAPAPTGGKITVSNGKETFRIDPAKEAEAAADGFQRI